MTKHTRLPRCTYRLQFHAEFGFREATRIAPYLASLGVSHVYASPIFRAAPGSSHGYDICDHNALNPELGSEEDFTAMTHAFHLLGLSLMLDFVPNHMSVADQGNLWWQSVLEHGPSSPYAGFFDVEWSPPKPSMQNRVLLPVLPEQYGRVLQAGGISLRFTDGRFFMDLPGVYLPVCLDSVLPVLHHATTLLDEPFAELLSIMTACRHLPSRQVDTSELKAERLRETGIIQERLRALCDQEPAVKKAIDAAIRAWGKEDGPAGLDRLDALLSDQTYRLASWRVAAEEINYRRFFDVDSLAAIRMERDDVFDMTHRLLLSLVAQGFVHGIRLDHIDGLARPDAYLRRLRKEVDARRPNGEVIPLYVEKILSSTECLPNDWPVHGTTGYEFANVVLRLLIDPESEAALTDCEQSFTSLRNDASRVIYESRQLIMHTSLPGEINMLGAMLARLAESHRDYRDFTLNALTRAIREVIASFPVYRSYLVEGSPVREEDREVIATALRTAQRNNPASERTVFAFVRRVLLPAGNETAVLDEKLRNAFVTKFQQCSSPVAAKGVEDTAMYRISRLLALNEVGGDPREFSMPAVAFHQLWTAPRQPHSLLATSTHDTKRSEDVRARLASLSECPARWSRTVKHWRAVNGLHKVQVDGRPAPDAREEYFLYQTLAGSWPLGEMDSSELANYRDRISSYMIKACREAKLNSSWISPDEEWEQAIKSFVDRILAGGRAGRFMRSLKPFVRNLQQSGLVNSLTQQVLKLTVPGVPDIYQGTELWDFSLVDPDNRRPVDYNSRRQRLAEVSDTLPAPPDDWAYWISGTPKIRVTAALLALRKAVPTLFSEGNYTSLATSGTFSDCCIAFMREAPGLRMLVVVPRFSSRVGFPPVGELWQDTRVSADLGDQPWQSLLAPLHRPLPGTADSSTGCPLSNLLSTLPAAVLVQGLTHQAGEYSADFPLAHEPV